jgi:AraC-like DNA-binding protein
MTLNASVSADIPKGTIWPPQGSPNWGGRDDLPLIYLGWGRRDFSKDPLAIHYDQGTNHFLILRGEIVVTAGSSQKSVRGPTALLFDPDCAFGISQAKSATVEILVWVWRDRPALPELRPEPGGFTALPLRQGSIKSLVELHSRCRNEVSLADGCLPRTLVALRDLMEVEILRASRPTPATGDVRWKLAHAWMSNNLAIHAPVPALCDYLRMSPSTLHRFFREQTGTSPGAYFRQLKTAEARRLIKEEGWQVKAAAHHLGYRHANDLSRALTESRING